ncbi:MAG TPA: hypothetical protein VFR94_10210 [Nitrososphaeraceae archaeon]|nr:hypothetical protein [Nitrososphaeraceae archaeon]
MGKINGIPSSTSYKGKEGILYNEELGRKIPRPIRLRLSERGSTANPEIK